ncbi:MAG: hypothetical protein ACTSYX_08520 [Candidatus Thorarchaeota archaeon]
MSGSERSQPLTPSTVEAIRMASISVLGVTTRRGYPIGSAVGSGSMMEQNSDTVAMSVAPLIFAVRDALYDSEGLEVLSMEWELEHAAGMEMVPEQLLIAGGGLEHGVGSHVCVLGWERGVIDPFKMDEYVSRVTKKIADIELAVEANELDYENAGVAVIRKFGDRLNKVLFVDMLDRQFQRSWDSLQIRQEHTKTQAVVTMEYHDDFTTMPPGIKITQRKHIRFVLPDGNEEDLIEHFKHRLLTPMGIETVAVKIPQLGQAVLRELNAYAYAIEETDVIKTAIRFLTAFLGADELPVSQAKSLQERATEFTSLMRTAMAAVREAANAHLKSGQTLPLSDHGAQIKSAVRAAGLEDMAAQFAEALVDDLVRSLERQFPTDSEFRAWQMRSAVVHFLLYCERVAQYFGNETRQYLLVASARQAFVAALQEFREQTVTPDMDEVSHLLFDKFYSELYAQLNAIFDRKAFEKSSQATFEEIISIIAREMIEVFGRIDMWDLIEFSDVAQIARTEIQKKYPSENSEPHPRARELMEMLDQLETLVAEIVPDIAQTLLSRAFIASVIERVVAGADLVAELYAEIDRLEEKPEEWRDEARRWIRLYEVSVQPSSPLSRRLLDFQELVHERAGTVVSAGSVIARVAFEAEARQKVYDAQLEAWKKECARIEAENAPILERKKKREELISQARADFALESAAYQRQVQEHHEKKAATESSGAPTDALVEPTPPEPLESRLAAVDAQYPPLGEPKPLPPKPEPSRLLINYTELRDLLTERITEMDESQEELERLFAQRLRRMEQEAAEMTERITVRLGDELFEHLLDYAVRPLGRLFPRPVRVYLRDSADRARIYLVSYENKPKELVVTIGDTVVR